MLDELLQKFEIYTKKHYPEMPLFRLKKEGIYFIENKLYRALNLLNLNEIKETLEQLLNKLKNHLQIDVSISLDIYPIDDYEMCGKFENKEGKYTIFLNPNYLTASGLINVLCHEISHAYQHIKGNEVYDANNYAISELYTDFLMIKMGFFEYVIEGALHPSFNNKLDLLGYLPSEILVAIDKETFTANKHRI